MDDQIQLLLACLRREEQAAKRNYLQKYSENDWEAVHTAALQNGVGPILFHTLKSLAAELEIPEEIWQRWQKIYFLSAGRNIKLYDELLDILAALNSRGISVILLKGAHLAEAVYGNIALRPMIDVDLLARKEDLLRVHQVLLEKGYLSADGELSCQLHLAPYEKNDALSIEVHFHITRPPVSGRIDLGGLWERAQKDSFQGVEVLVLAPEDLILHLVAHTCIDHGLSSGLIPYLDVRQAAEHYGDKLDWAQLWERGADWGMERAVLLMLSLTEKMLGLSFPEQIREKIKPNLEEQAFLAAAEDLVFEPEGQVSPIIARMFSRQGGKEKLKVFFKRTFPSKEKMTVTWQEPASKKGLQLYRLYPRRVRTLIKRHGKTIWLGLRRDPQTIRELELENKKNELRDWLTKNGPDG